MDKLVSLGPTFLVKAKHHPTVKEFDRPITIELWLYLDGLRILEVSTKCVPKEVFQVAADFKAYLAVHGLKSAWSVGSIFSAPVPPPLSLPSDP